MKNVKLNLALSCILASPFLLTVLMVGAQGADVGSSAEMLASPSSITGSDIMIDVSPDATKYIEGAVSIPYSEFVEAGGVMKPVSEIVGLLGGKGISQDDSVVIYGECLPCGGGPSASTYVYWIFRYLGHENVRMLDGTVEDWANASKPTADTPQTRPRAIYIPKLKANLLSTYDFVKNGDAQIVDARTAQEYSAGSVTGAINIPYDQVLINDTIKDEAALMELFSKLSRDKPVVVYSNTGVKASLVWFALTLTGYDGRLYSWKDWLESQPTLNLGLKEIRAEPNPAVSGTPVRIVAVFGEGELNRTVEEPASNETILTVKGCVTCEPITIYTGGSLSGTKREVQSWAPSVRLRLRPSRARQLLRTLRAKRLPE